MLSIAAVLALTGGEAVRAQGCNPVIDGTYCASQPDRRAQSAAGRAGVSIQPVQGIASDLSLDRDRPGTFGAVSFQGGSTCIGLLRRGACK